VIDTIPRLPFRSTGSQEFEAVAVSALERRMRVGSEERLHRLEFHLVTVITSGAGWREVDFRSIDCQAGTTLWTRPGQVQRFGGGDLDGIHLLFTDAFLASLPAPRGLAQPNHVRFAGDASNSASITALAQELLQEFSRADASHMIMQLTLRTLLAHLNRAGTVFQDVQTSTFERFLSEVEHSFQSLHSVEEYADALGYSVRTIARATEAVAGTTPKQVIDRRIALEAQRLLGYTDLPVARIAPDLGFSEPTNFSRFFLRATGSTTTEFRNAQQAVKTES